jgi:hypothetical protein
LRYPVRNQGGFAPTPKRFLWFYCLSWQIPGRYYSLALRPLQGFCVPYDACPFRSVFAMSLHVFIPIVLKSASTSSSHQSGSACPPSSIPGWYRHTIHDSRLSNPHLIPVHGHLPISFDAIIYRFYCMLFFTRKAYAVGAAYLDNVISIK